MTYWIFKIADQELYPDIPGKKYVYDNRHSINVCPNDVFIYLDKRDGGYAFSGTGYVSKIEDHPPANNEQQQDSRIRTIYTALINDMVWFNKPLSISPRSKEGRRNRSRLGIIDVNLLGWSQSIPNIGETMYTNILDLAQEHKLIPDTILGNVGFLVDDSWGKVRRRGKMARFSEAVLQRHMYRCAVCGTQFKPVLTAAHLSPYATDKKNRANPKNGICLCTFCHAALDKRQIAIKVTGEITVNPEINDALAIKHFTGIDPEVRVNWLSGIDIEFLRLTEKLYSANVST